MKKSQHGGTRKGAGRKPAPVKLVSFRISIDHTTHEWFKAEAERRGISVSALYRKVAQDATWEAVMRPR